MDRLRSSLALAAALSVFLIPAGAPAAKVYTTDSEELPLHLTPSNSGKTILMVPPASAVELVNPQSFTKVRYTRPDGQIREGWLPSRLISLYPSGSAQAKALQAENEALKSQLGQLDTEKTELSQKEKDLTDKLARLNAAYEELKGGSANYLKLKSENDSAKTSLAGAQENIQMLVRENESLKLARDVRWIVATVSVLMTGWVLGWATGRRRRKKGIYF